jgi:hypothetical protein
MSANDVGNGRIDAGHFAAPLRFRLASGKLKERLRVQD